MAQNKPPLIPNNYGFFSGQGMMQGNKGFRGGQAQQRSQFNRDFAGASASRFDMQPSLSDSFSRQAQIQSFRNNRGFRSGLGNQSFGDEYDDFGFTDFRDVRGNSEIAAMQQMRQVQNRGSPFVGGGDYPRSGSYNDSSNGIVCLLLLMQC